jgi:hypothetical protein
MVVQGRTIAIRRQSAGRMDDNRKFDTDEEVAGPGSLLTFHAEPHR